MDRKRMTQLVNSTTSSSHIMSSGITSVISVESRAPRSSALIGVRNVVPPLSTSRVPTHHAKQPSCKTQTFTASSAYLRHLKPSQASLSSSRTIQSEGLSQCVISSPSARWPSRIRSGSRAKPCRAPPPQECLSSIRARVAQLLRMRSRSTRMWKEALKVEAKHSRISRTRRTCSTASSHSNKINSRMKG